MKIWNILMAPGRAMHQRAETVKKEKEQFQSALKQLDLERIEAGYRSDLDQRTLEAVDWKKPWPTARLIETERSKIAHYIEDHWAEAGFPGDPGMIVRKSMQVVWAKLQGRLHQRTFGTLELPAFFDIQRDPNGLILFERTRRDTDQYGTEEWIGQQSHWIYGHNPPQFSDPLQRRS